MKTDTVRINEVIPSKRINLIGEGGERFELKREDAIKLAFEQGLDLVEFDCSEGVSTCKILDYSKFLYQKKKKQKNSSSQSSKQKQLTFSPRTEEHDLTILVNKAKAIMSDGDKVKFTIKFKGREMSHTRLGFEKMNFILSSLGEEIIVESPPRLLGMQLSMEICAQR